MPAAPMKRWKISGSEKRDWIISVSTLGKPLGNSFRKIAERVRLVAQSSAQFLAKSGTIALSYGPIMILGSMGDVGELGGIGANTRFFTLNLSRLLQSPPYFSGLPVIESYLDVYWIVFAAGVWRNYELNQFKCALLRRRFSEAQKIKVTIS